MLKENLNKLHTTALGVERIKKNLCLNVDDVVNWCRLKIKDPKAVITRKKEVSKEKFFYFQLG